MSDLVRNIAETIEGQSYLQPKGEPIRVLVYVEGYEDIRFWYLALQPTAKAKNIAFDIQTPTQGTGKPKVLDLAKNIAKSKTTIFCVDSDYDYLLSEHSEHARLMKAHEYVFQTYTYAIENYLCYAESLAIVSVQMSLNSQQLIDWCDWLKRYSQAVYPLFLWSLWIEAAGSSEHFTRKEDFAKLIRIPSIPSISNIEQCLTSICNKCSQQVNKFVLDFPCADIAAIEQSIKAKGVTADNCYLFLRGHDLKEGVIQMLFQALSSFLRSDKESSISKDATDNHQIETIGNVIKKYKTLFKNSAHALDLNTEYQSCWLYVQIQQDLNNYASKFPS